MAHHYYERDVRPPLAHAASSDERRHMGLFVVGAALAALVAIAWMATRPPGVDSHLPQPAPEALTAPLAGPAVAAAAPEAFKAPAPVPTTPAQPAPAVAASVSAAVPAPIAGQALPSAEDVAATGDTRAVQP